MYYLVIALQVFCIYHLFKNRNSYYWFFVIIFLPALGSIIYLITQVYNKRDAEKISNEIATIINPTKKVKDLEKALQFSETYQNRINLADAYFEIKDYKNASHHYLKPLNDNYQNNFYIGLNLVDCFYELGDYDEALNISEKIKKHSEFDRSRAQFLYGLILEKFGKYDEAKVQLQNINQRYSNYEERLILAKMLISRNEINEAKELLGEIYTESQYMTKPNRKIYRYTIIEVEKLMNEI
ncbi:hypothetical protein A9Q87_01220 [Flavobacteriales bacterium 34_180_T64]|nr:hypothetical protein A9Q87_01220 [Flavobacteriales bacterium 34_180_T64]